MASIGVPELLIIFAIVLILLGPGRLTGIGAALGESIRSFRDAVRDEQQPDAQKGYGEQEDAKPDRDA